MAAPGRIGQRVGCADERSCDEAAVRTGEIEGGIEPLPAQRAKDVPVFPPRRTLSGEWNGPGPVHTRGQLEQFSADRCREGVKFGRGVASFDLPKRRRQVNRIAKKAKIDDNDFFGGAGALKKLPVIGAADIPDLLASRDSGCQ